MRRGFVRHVYLHSVKALYNIDNSLMETSIMKTIRRANDLLTQHFPWFGIAGGIVITIAVLITAFT